MIDNFNSEDSVLDLQEGNFIDHQPTHPNFIDGKNAHRDGEDYKVLKVEKLIAPLQLHLAPGGGAALLLKRK